MIFMILFFTQNNHTNQVNHSSDILHRRPVRLAKGVRSQIFLFFP